MKEQQRPNSITVLIESITKYLNPIDSWQPKIILDLADAKPVQKTSSLCRSNQRVQQPIKIKEQHWDVNIGMNADQSNLKLIEKFLNYL